ncbi:MBL fold metallo-hydrolase [Amycolatopsis nigrescens]|uniref:MBL fold metallo-hydrolase n=1 Tax=Amycolatopsis nigrescens TaxID=381445 RepID=UPI00058AE878|nr:MBL fold metallo-hydrolase [Amycolatopsis nigrescens]
MLVVGFPAGTFQANCYLLATGRDRPCVVVDPGEDAAGPIEDALREHGLSPVGVLATHGHFDHVFSAAEVADAHRVPLWIHPDDRILLTDPFHGLRPGLAAALGTPPEMTEPAEVAELGAGRLDLAGLTITVHHTPGHTPGSMIFRLDTEEGGRLALTGDTLLAGTVGRTNLPGGSAAELDHSLRTSVLTWPDETVVLPGHGASTTIGKERAQNPYLRKLAGAVQSGRPA